MRPRRQPPNPQGLESENEKKVASGIQACYNEATLKLPQFRW